MSEPQPNKPAVPPIVVVGGGISGLAAAHRLTELLPSRQIKLFEASTRVGGVLQTVRENGYLIETSADNFITKMPWAEALCQRVGIAGDLLPTEPSLRRALVVSRGRVLPVPEAFVLMSAGRIAPVLTTSTLSIAGKLRLMLEPFIRRRENCADESVADFARRRLGNETFQRLVQPLVAGIYTADPEKLSMRATMPQFVEKEQQFGSLWRARQGEKQQADSGARYSSFVAPLLGMSHLVEAITDQLPPGTIQLNSPIAKLSREEQGGHWLLHRPDGSTFAASAVVLATPATRAAGLLEEVDTTLSGKLSEIQHASTSVVVLGVRRDQVARPINGFGFVVPQIENRQIIAASFASYKFPNRAPADRLLVRVFIGGALQPELAELPDDKLQAIAKQELAELVGLTGEPELARVYRWGRSMPQYHLGHVEHVESIESRTASIAGLELAGNAYRGVGIPQCVRSGKQAAERIAAYFHEKTG